MGKSAISQELIALGNRIRDRRLEIKLSQEVIAEKAGISTNTVSRIEGGHSAMSIEIFIKLIQILDIDANELLGVKLPDLENEELDSEMADEIQNLKQDDQKVVRQTIGALIEALQQYRP